MRMILPSRKLRNRRFLRNFTLCVIVVLLYKTSVLHSFLVTFVMPIMTDMKKYEPFEPEVYTDLNFKTNGVPKIERNIHQTWKDTNIPSQFVDNIKSFVQNNPSWKYYFWTDESARQLIVDHYPQLLPVWDGVWYSNYPIRKADALRYVVLHRYGGIYADLDMINYRSLETAITKHSCIFTPEPFEHAVFWTYRPLLLSNDVMLCASKHPFLQRLIGNLFSTEFYENAVDATGPGYITTQFYIHNALPYPNYNLEMYDDRSMKSIEDNSPYMYKGGIYTLTHKNSVYIANTRYFIYSMDKSLYGRIVIKCLFWRFQDRLHRRSCLDVQVLGLHRNRHRFAFTEHQWATNWNNRKDSLFFSDHLIRWFSTDITEIVSNPILYK